MSLFDDFQRLQDSVNALMGDFGARQQGGRGGRHGRRRGGHGGGLFGDVGLGDPWLGMDPMMDMDFYSMPLLNSGGGGDQGQNLQLAGGKQGAGDETKMDESAAGGGSSTLSTQQGGGQQLAQRPQQLPVLRCRVNIEEQKDKYAITAEVPGFDKDNLKVNISDNNVLTITGEQKQEHVEQSKEKKYIRTERSFGRIQRSLQLPKNVGKEGVTASYENGILHVNIPKKEEPQPQQQQIQIS